MKVEIYTDSTIFDTLHQQWNSLLTQSPSPTIFLTWQWQNNWWKHFGTPDGLRLLTVQDEKDQLVGIAPFYAQPSSAGKEVWQLVGGTEVSDYLDVIAQTDCEEAVLSSILDFCCENDDCCWDVFDLHNLPAASLTSEVFASLATRRGYTVQKELEDVCPVLPLPATWDEYLASLDKKQRHEIRRKIRRAEGATNLEWYVVRDKDSLATEVEDFLELHQKSSAEKSEFMDEAMKNYFRDLAALTFTEGWLELYFIKMDGHKSASILCFDYENTISVYNSGFDPERYTQLSPGIVLLSYCIQHAIERGRALFDFLQGDEEYKYRFGAKDTEVHHLVIERD